MNRLTVIVAGRQLEAREHNSWEESTFGNVYLNFAAVPHSKQLISYHSLLNHLFFSNNNNLSTSVTQLASLIQSASDDSSALLVMGSRYEEGMDGTDHPGSQENIAGYTEEDKQSVRNLESTTLGPNAAAPVPSMTGNFPRSNPGWGASMGQLWQVGLLNNPMNNPGFQQHGAIPFGLSSSVPSETEFVHWNHVPFMNQDIRASHPVDASSLHPYRVNGLSVGVLPNQQVAQPLQSYTAGMVLANVGSLCSVATEGTGGAKLKRSLSETQRQPEGLLASSPPVRPRKKSLGQRAYNSEPPQGSSSTFTESVDTAKRTSLYRGVSYHRRDRKWTARTWLNGKMVHIGMYKSERMAALMVDLRNLDVLGSSCHKKLNFTPLERRSLAKELAQEPKCPFAIKYYARD
eukprot:CAMPEP_0203764942 /NCGR_PEP_ID=MMETSP0098-20131031/18138_1 /ASSEMBLY_ACC=CAM_ASM_000208 /TAXON_ID=96639 /ORGANISM=" , Strain NY0313808BC1" /LENGTH=403 /DNA_ID=CAMNT_0050661145 /DNA_START=548 /DNA_END=1760 /DNA_ORIENTATION=+